MRRRAVMAYALACLAGCAPPWAGHPGMGWRWKAEPTVGASTQELQRPTVRALEAWGYGRPLPSCAGADVCVIAGTRHHAGPVGQRCIAEVATPVRWETVAHELGHCFGLPHSDNELSVMYPRYMPGMDVLEEDRRALR